IAQLAGGAVRPGRVDAWPRPKQPARIWVRPARVSSVLGTQVSSAEVDRRLSALGLVPVDGNSERRLWEVPSWRGDLTREIDCVEEIARTRGYDTIPVELHRAGIGETAAATLEEMASEAGRNAL